MGGNLLVNLFFTIVVIWSIAWKIYSTWIAVKHGDKKWFVALIILNTIGILDMIYVFGIRKKKWSDLDKAFRRFFS
jgi:hypothetical protein